MDGGYGATEDEEDQLVQMVQQFIESSSPSNNTCPPNYVALSVCREKRNRLHLFFFHEEHAFMGTLLFQDMVESETELEAELLECVLRHMRKMDNGHAAESRSVRRRIAKKLKMDGYRASLCHSRWVSSLGCPGGDHEYVNVMVRNDKQSSSSTLTRLIIDVDFKSQFQLARPTDAYRQLVEILPSVFIGDERKLEGIVSLVCSAAKQSLVDRGLHVPPWRTAAYVMSKWRSSPTTSNV
ncbi:hypothetical protein MLD38_028435 [Melastoma candidum]|uniref:Uncharacterized protein n=1 Tax=Melastoma candidum TaxID=119954 RepID=A0ACB9N0T5_9MYRT|nr:hypothetical protein MLD38_028435 [Melastoma candidum]